MLSLTSILAQDVRPTFSHIPFLSEGRLRRRPSMPVIVSMLTLLRLVTPFWVPRGLIDMFAVVPRRDIPNLAAGLSRHTDAPPDGSLYRTRTPRTHFGPE